MDDPQEPLEQESREMPQGYLKPLLSLLREDIENGFFQVLKKSLYINI